MTRLPAAPARDDRRGLAAWLAALAPGMLLTRVLVLGTLLVVPWLSAAIHIDAAVRIAALVLLWVHVVGMECVRRGRPAVAVGSGMMLLVIDALACGALLGASISISAPAVALAAVPLGLAIIAAGRAAASMCVVALALGGVLAWWTGSGSPLIFSPLPTFLTALTPDVSFGGTPAIAAAPAAPPTVLDLETSFGGRTVERSGLNLRARLTVDTWFAGAPALQRGDILFAPALALALSAFSLGGAVSVWRVRPWRAAERLPSQQAEPLPWVLQ